MANDINITVVGNLTSDPELRYTQNGLPVANFTIAQTPRSFDKATNTWKDGEPVFLRSSIWREPAEHVATSFQKGQRVIATGTLKQRSYQDKNSGENRTAYELEVEEIGASVRYGTSVFTKSASATQNAQAAAMAPAQASAAPVAQAAPVAAQAAPAAPVAAQVAAPAAAAPVLEPQF